MFSAVRSLLPQRIKRPVRRALDALSAVRRLHALRRCVRELRRQVAADALDPQLFLDLRAAWGNESMSADATFVAEIASRVLRTPGPFLDCGCGLTTIVAGVIASQRGDRVWSLEQHDVWYQHTRHTLCALDLANVVLWYTPLRSYGEFAWYDLDGRILPRQFSHVFCDGPAIGPRRWRDPVYSNWRVGVVPVLQAMQVRFDEIILDDADDPRSTQVCRRWNELGVATRVVSTHTGPFVLGRPLASPLI